MYASEYSKAHNPQIVEQNKKHLHPLYRFPKLYTLWINKGSFSNDDSGLIQTAAHQAQHAVKHVKLLHSKRTGNLKNTIKYKQKESTVEIQSA